MLSGRLFGAQPLGFYLRARSRAAGLATLAALWVAEGHLLRDISSFLPGCTARSTAVVAGDTPTGWWDFWHMLAVCSSLLFDFI